MSKLRPYLADIASAIREKKGSSEPINAKDFSNEIRNIQSGAVELERNDVNFYDYDGTLLFAYTLAETQALTELPTPPTHEGLVFQGWNWDYEDVIALDYPMDIGAMYITDDGKTRFYLEVEDEEGVDIELGFTQTANDVIVDFGDGSPTQTSADAKAIIPHHYAKGSYVLKMWSQGKKKYTFEQSGATRNIFGGVADVSATILRKIELGNNSDVSSYGFIKCTNLETISVYREISGTFGWTSSFEYCLRLKHLNIPKGSQYLYGSVMTYCMSLKSMTLPNTPILISGGAATRNGLRFVRISQNANISKTSPFTYTEIEEFDFIAKSTASDGFFRECKKLKKVKNIQGCVIYKNFFVGCYSLEEVEIPEDQTIIYANSFTDCDTLRELIFPKGITTIQSSAFGGSGIGKFDFSALEAVPTLENTNAFSGTLATSKIIVPDALYDDWKAATNWSTYADRIVKASEYNG
jgi:hypothetical protein